MTQKRQVRKPLVSVVMPVYNAQKYVGQAIKSILRQTYRNFELIIVNDASTDRSLQIIKRYKKRYPRKIKIIDLKENLNKGGDACANEGLKVARGKYIARMDADDVAVHERLAKQVAFLEGNPEVFLVGSNAYVIDQKGEIMGEKREPAKNSAISQSYFTFNPIIHPTALFRATYLSKQPFRYIIQYSANNDYYTFFKLNCQGAVFANLARKLLYHRIHDGNDTFLNIKEKFANTLKARIEMVRTFGYEPTLKQLLITFAQSAIVFTLPERLLRDIYLLAKGIVRPEIRIQRVGIPHLRLRYN